MSIRDPDLTRTRFKASYLWNKLNRIQLFLELSDQDVAKLADLSLSRYQSLKSSEQDIPAFSLCLLLERLEIDWEVFISGTLDYEILGRRLSEIGRLLTGIDIHPGATLAPTVIIEHGGGVVIGETAVIGDGTVILQGVTLGSRRISSFDTGSRHPKVGKNVMIGAGAKILGPIEIDDGAWIGANSVVLSHVPKNCSAIGAPARIKPHRPVRKVA